MPRNQYQARKALSGETQHKCCVICGDTREPLLDAAHLDNNPENNDPDNLAWLCKNHHRMVDDGLYPIEIVKRLRSEWSRHRGVGTPKLWMNDAGEKAARTRKRRAAARKAVLTKAQIAASQS